MKEKSKNQLVKPDISALVAQVDKENPKREDIIALRRALAEDTALIKANDLTEKAFATLESDARGAFA